MSSAYQAIEDLVRTCSHFNKATTSILGEFTILEHGESTSDVSNHGETIHLSGARYHRLQALET